MLNYLISLSYSEATIFIQKKENYQKFSSKNIKDEIENFLVEEINKLYSKPKEYYNKIKII